MSVKIIDDRSIWDSFVENSPDKLLFHKWDFLKIIEKHSGYTLLPFGIFDESKKNLKCLFPLFFYKKMGMKFLFSQPPGSGIPYIGLLLNPEYYSFKQRQKESYLNEVVAEINKEFVDISPNYIYLFFGPHIQDIRPFTWNHFENDVNYTYTINLTLPLETLWNSFDKNCRTKIRSGEKHNLFLKEENDTKTLCSIMNDRYREQGLNFLFFGSDYLDDILEAFPQNVKMYVIYNDGKKIDYAINIEYNGRVILWLGGVSLEKTIHSNEFSIWEFIKNAKSEGFKILEIHGADIERLCTFKSKFNPSIESNFSVMKKDLIGRTSELVYTNYLRRIWFMVIFLISSIISSMCFVYACLPAGVYV